MHPDNLHNASYDFERLIESHKRLGEFVFLNKYGNKSIDFSNQGAVLHLNKALLKCHYQVENWDIPKNYLCPPIPGRADYIHYLNDLLAEENIQKEIKGIDIGVGGNAIYPILANRIYGWQMLGTDIEKRSVENAKANIKANPEIADNVEIIHQEDRGSIFKGVLKPEEHYRFSMCNPPFHASEKEAKKAASRKIKNLGLESSELNFGGQANELWCNGGEALFIKRMIKESVLVKEQIDWFTSLVSKKENLPKIYKLLKKSGAQFKTIEMDQGNKKSRFIAWTFL
ncbi:23S rRNA (adenine(1618)-N(6))-methyltransferase RlmF [Christiangramia sp. SM2212]|uniref:Ribosomal RNA large subunit methyltransferase F n=1 Tax=Christiangramia sediminicola TaxID=3073267 RepID=A0ABU1ERK8_9FLAO|nr:23S rRNA (adenine(1618)-N(6))-methyltransferase RlmF [Christiangramia sp. SM2212]MDR5591022.1 23S rRNA (adenine(1618)-N(6))-methyltransferase RlmF [Christiangramia sp. SM2212]